MKEKINKYISFLCCLCLLFSMAVTAYAQTSAPAFAFLTLQEDGLVYYSSTAESGTMQIPLGTTKVQVNYTLVGDEGSVSCNGSPVESGDLVDVSKGSTLTFIVSSGAASKEYQIHVEQPGVTGVAYTFCVVPSGTANSNGEVYYSRNEDLIYDIFAKADSGENIGSFNFTLDYQKEWLSLDSVAPFSIAGDAKREYQINAGAGTITIAAAMDVNGGIPMTGSYVKIASVKLKVINYPAVGVKQVLSPILSHIVATPKGYDDNSGFISQDTNVNKAVLFGRAAPDVSGIDASGRNASDGKIIRTDDTMEYSSDGGETWHSCQNTETTGLLPGTYLVRYRAAEDLPPSDKATVIIGYPTPGPGPGPDSDENPSFDYMICPRDETCPIEPFTDTVNDYWWHDGIHYCVENGLMVGYPGSIFGPYDPLSRAQIVVILWRMEGSPAVGYAMTFEDVSEGQWYTEAVRWAQSTGVVLGYSDEAFGPNDNITREQLAAILHRYAGYKKIDVSMRASLAEYTDVHEISDWAIENVRWANAAGMIQGRTLTTIVPKDDTSRAEAAAMIQRFCVNIIGYK